MLRCRTTKRPSEVRHDAVADRREVSIAQSVANDVHVLTKEELRDVIDFFRVLNGWYGEWKP